MVIAASVTRGIVGWSGAFAIAAIPLVGMMVAVPQADPLDSIVTYVFWWGVLGLLIERLARSDPTHAWQWAACGEFGFLCGVICAMAIGLRLGEPMNLWPLTLLWSLLVSTPPVILGCLFGRKRGSPLRGPSLR